MTSDRPIILVTNDDGITAPGIAALVNAVKHLGEVVVVAPDSPQSGMGHAITISEPLRLDKVDIFKGIICYQTSGTPADCVKLAVSKVLHRKPDLVVSGINHGSNASINVIYSGTMSAAVEGAIEGIPSIGFSLLNYAHDADMEAAGKVAHKMAKMVLEKGLPEGVLLNVNIPYCDFENIKGYKVCRQARAKYNEEFDERKDPHGRNYFWLRGDFANFDHGDDTDVFALKNNFVSIVPTQFDLTAHHAIGTLNTWNF
ncbi:MAG: 5'/3'-nucleotidase SurE [Bacteroidetes bacterium]|nr:5'/3'-nucleotidase SurE [Bacteroidota bacterium]